MLSTSSDVDRVRQLTQSMPHSGYFIVEDDNQIIGLTTRENILSSTQQFNGTTIVGEIAAQDYITVTKDTTLLEIVARIRAERASMVLVIPTVGTVSADQVVGLITKEQIADALAETAELFSE
jgi:predicted transcriptional regulator